VVNRDERHSLREPMNLAAYPATEHGVRLV
jgi:hypothetical protein